MGLDEFTKKEPALTHCAPVDSVTFGESKPDSTKSAASIFSFVSFSTHSTNDTAYTYETYNSSGGSI